MIIYNNTPRKKVTNIIIPKNLSLKREITKEEKIGLARLILVMTIECL